MIIEVLSDSKEILGHSNASNVDNAELLRVVHTKHQHSSVVQTRFLQVVSSDFALPALEAKAAVAINKGNTAAKNFDNLTTGGDAFTTGLQIHGGGFGLTFGPTAVISVLSSYDNNGDNTGTFTIGASAGGSATAYPEDIPQGLKFFFGSLTGSVKATYCLTPGSVTYIKKSGSDKVFVTPGAFATTGSATTVTNVRIEKIKAITKEVNIR